MPVRPGKLLLVVLVFFASTATAQAPQTDDMLARAQRALGQDDYTAAVGLTTEGLEAEPGDARLLLARSLAHYRLGNLAEAETDLSSALTASRESGASPSTNFQWPEDFLQWVSTVRAVYAPETDLPDMSLDELNTAAPTRSVTAHFVMDVEVVRIPVIVEDTRGFLGGLQPEDFGVVDGEGLPQPIRELIPEDEPTSIGILVDAGPEVPVEGARQAVSKLLEALLPEDEVFVAQFSDDVRFLSDFTTDRIALAAAMAGYSQGSRRAIHDALALGMIRMRNARFEKKALIVIAHGDDDGSTTLDSDVLLAARREGVAVHALLTMPAAKRWRPSATDVVSPTLEQATAEQAEETPEPETFPAGNAGVLQEISHNTGGLVAVRPTVEEQFGGFSGWLELACSDVSDYINNQYLILFRSTRPPQRGVWRELRIDVRPRHERIRARSGYIR